MPKDVNIHIKTPGAEDARRQLDQTAKSAKDVGDKTDQAGRAGAAGMEKSAASMGRMGRVMATVKGQVTAFIGAWLGLSAVQRVISYLIQSMERVQQLQKQIHQETQSLLAVGQALEYQTGTQGMQRRWAGQALALQRAGGLASTEAAQQMMISADIAFGAQGGIKNQDVLMMLRKIAPYFGAAQFGGQEIAKAFELAGTMGVEPTPQGYQKYMAQLHAAYAASKATEPGAFIMGLQQGATAYLAAGGTPVEALATFASARFVSQSEARAGTAMEQMTRLSSGAYARPRQAMEKALGVSWSDLSVDQQMQAMIQYAGTIPPALRMQVMAEQGFPPELVSVVAKMTSAGAAETMAATRQKVYGASAATEGAQVQAYLGSELGRQRVTDAGDAIARLLEAKQFSGWQRRLGSAQKRFEALNAAGRDRRSIPDEQEPTVIALEELINDIDSLMESPGITGPQRQEAQRIRDRAQKWTKNVSGISGWAEGILLGSWRGERAGQEIFGEYESLRGQMRPAINVHNGDNYYPRDGGGPQMRTSEFKPLVNQ